MGGYERTRNPMQVNGYSPKPIVDVSATLLDAKVSVNNPALTARALGFTGDMCENCSSTRMVRTGTCITCQECGANKGCS